MTPITPAPAARGCLIYVLLSALILCRRNRATIKVQ